jgi:hypothetical protein
MFARPVHASTVRVNDLCSDLLPAFASDQPCLGCTPAELDEFSMSLWSLFSELDCEPASALGLDLEELNNADIISTDELSVVPLALLPGSGGCALLEVNEPHQQKRKLQLQKVSMLRLRRPFTSDKAAAAVTVSLLDKQRTCGVAPASV